MSEPELAYEASELLVGSARKVAVARYHARELAMSRMQAEAEELHAEGIVGVQLRQHSHTWGSHTTEFFAIGTAVRPLRPDHIIERPTMVLTLDA